MKKANTHLFFFFFFGDWIDIILARVRGFVTAFGFEILELLDVHLEGTIVVILYW